MHTINIFEYINQYEPTLTLVLLALVFILLICIIVFSVKLSRTTRRYKNMMHGIEGGNLEAMLLHHLATVDDLSARVEALREEVERQDQMLRRAITRVGVVRFRAFDDMGSDLSYAVALIDAHNNGVILSSIFAREDSRSYVKPIENGQSTYVMSDEEQEALKKAMQS